MLANYRGSSSSKLPTFYLGMALVRNKEQEKKNKELERKKRKKKKQLFINQSKPAQYSAKAMIKDTKCLLCFPCPGYFGPGNIPIGTDSSPPQLGLTSKDKQRAISARLYKGPIRCHPLSKRWRKFVFFLNKLPPTVTLLSLKPPFIEIGVNLLSLSRTGTVRPLQVLLQARTHTASEHRGSNCRCPTWGLTNCDGPSGIFVLLRIYKFPIRAQYLQFGVGAGLT